MPNAESVPLEVARTGNLFDSAVQRDRPDSRNIAIIGAPVNFGQEKPGVDMGPYAIRFPAEEQNEWLVSRLRHLGHTVDDNGGEDIEVDKNFRARIMRPRDAEGSTGYHREEVLRASKELSRKVGAALEEGRFPLVLGGDHSVGIGSIAGTSGYYHRQGKKIGLIWIDAHADMNTPESSDTHHIHGMPLACCIGDGDPELTELGGFKPKIDPKNVVLMGIRDVDCYQQRPTDERRRVITSGIRHCTMREIDEHGIHAVMERAFKCAMDGTDGYHVSFDMDFVDPTEAPGVGTRVRGGGTFREAHLIMEMICDQGKMRSLDVVEVNPLLDDQNRTAKLARHLIESAMGKSIL